MSEEPKEDRFTRIDLGKLGAAIEGLDSAFRWDETREGRDMWLSIYLRLKEIRHAREMANCGAKQGGREMIFYDLHDRVQHEAATEACYRESRRLAREEKKRGQRPGDAA